MEEIPPVKKSRLITLFKRKRDLPEDHRRQESEGRARDHKSRENLPEDFPEGDEREMHRKWYRKHPALLKEYLKRRMGKIKKSFFIDRKA